MKRGWFAVGMIALSLLLGGAEYLYVTTSADVYIRMLDEADEKMAQNEVYEAASISERLDNRYRKQSGIFNIFMYHSEVGHISCDLAMLQEYARAGSVDEFLATSACARREIQQIRNLKQLKWENLF